MSPVAIRNFEGLRGSDQPPSLGPILLVPGSGLGMSYRTECTSFEFITYAGAKMTFYLLRPIDLAGLCFQGVARRMREVTTRLRARSCVVYSARMVRGMDGVEPCNLGKYLLKNCARKGRETTVL